MIVVSDTSAITSLLQVDNIVLLQRLYGEVLIPEAVRDELQRTHPSLPSFIRCQPVANTSDVRRLLAEIDIGEAEAIVLSRECRADVLLIDDLEGRRVARREGVPFIGLLGVLVQAKQLGHIVSVRKFTEDLERLADFHLSPEVKAIAFRKAGE